MKLTQQESQVLSFLSQRKEVYWEELAQFCKDPSSVKLKSVQKVVSDLRKKFRDNNQPVPFNCTFRSLVSKQEPPKMVATSQTVQFNGQQLVQVKRQAHIKPVVDIIKALTDQPTVPQKIENPTAQQLDFALKQYARQVVTRSGIYSLNSDEYELFDYFMSNRGRFVSLEELRDNVCYPKFGSKTPARWFSAIQRRVGNIRHQVPETRNKLLTAKQNNNSGYIFS